MNRKRAAAPLGHALVGLALVGFALLLTGSTPPAMAQHGVVRSGAPTEIAPASRIEPAALAEALQSGTKPLVLYVGPRTFYDQAHISGAEFTGAASTQAGVHALAERLAGVPKDQWIVLYCGCCPWDRCPNIRPAFQALQALGFTHLQALNLPHNFGADWVDKSYPTDK